MKTIIKQIREKMNMSQTEFGEKLGVSFSTINRWENGKAYPNNMAQLNILELAYSNNISVAELVYEKIKLLADAIPSEKDRVILYHGSKSGIEGKIKPNSRAKCDFGRGFYMGTIPEQPLTLICDYVDSKFYILSFDMENLNSLELQPDVDWAMYVAFNRGKMESIKGSGLYKKYEKYSEKKDIVIGSIADDRMFFVLDNFFQGNVTDKALVESLSVLGLGKQFVAVSEKACRNIRIEKEVDLSLLEKKSIEKEAEKLRAEGISKANEICRENRRKGKFFDEIIETYER